jgi:NAD(P)-dependent dehydrogenase (short-subunit alcohol dehydrogenase family)
LGRLGGFAPRSHDSTRLLRGKVSIITGAGRGIGRTLSLTFAKSGATLALVSRTERELESTSEEVRSIGSLVLARECDVSRPRDVKSLVHEVVRRFGRVDVLVNNAGILGPIGPLEKNKAADWLAAIRVNLFGTFLFCKYVVPVMKNQGHGTILNISGAGAPAPYPRFTAYSSSKTAVLGLTQTLAAELADFGIQVNAIAPGITNTRMQDEIISAGELAGDSFRRANEVKESGGTDPSKVGDLAVFLCSDAANRITGRLFSAKWDNWQSLASARKAEDFIASQMYTIRRIDGVFFDAIRRD